MLSLILPAYNEARRLPASLAACAEFFVARGLPGEIIVVDDGSSDATPRAFADTVQTLPRGHLEYRYLGLEHRGKGGAVKAGVLAAACGPALDALLWPRPVQSPRACQTEPAHWPGAR